jgi:hypothetical protein
LGSCHVHHRGKQMWGQRHPAKSMPRILPRNL